LFNKNSMFFYPLLLLFSLIISGCEKTDHSVEIQFALTYDDAAFSCDDKFVVDGLAWQLSQLQFYISEIEVKDARNNWQSARVNVENSAAASPPAAKNTTSSSVALMGGICGQAQTWRVNLASPIARDAIGGLKFTLGVPQHLNHLNPLTQPSPLNQSDMFWTWQLGYKFVRMELASPNHQWIFHLGSTGCQSASPVRPPEAPCLFANRPTIVLDNFTEEKTIALDLSALLKDIKLSQDNSCQSAQDLALCQQLFERVGISNPQQIFKVF
jgi:uncharacterized repeat protein (TIGR04052 family)